MSQFKIDRKTVLTLQELETQIVVWAKNPNSKPVVDIGCVGGSWLEGVTIESVAVIIDPAYGCFGDGGVAVAVLVVSLASKPKMVACMYLGPEGQEFDLDFPDPEIRKGRPRSRIIVFDKISISGRVEEG